MIILFRFFSYFRQTNISFPFIFVKGRELVLCIQYCFSHHGNCFSYGSYPYLLHGSLTENFVILYFSLPSLLLFCSILDPRANCCLKLFLPVITSLTPLTSVIVFLVAELISFITSLLEELCVLTSFIILLAFRWLYLVQSGALILHQNKFKPTSVEPSPSPNVMSLAWVISVPINGETL